MRRSSMLIMLALCVTASVLTMSACTTSPTGPTKAPVAQDYVIPNG